MHEEEHLDDVERTIMRREKNRRIDCAHFYDNTNQTHNFVMEKPTRTN